MRQFTKLLDQSPPAVPIPAVTSLARSTMAKPATYQFSGGQLDSCCLNCEPKYCIRFVEPEIPPHAPIHARRVCPTDAILFSEQERTVEISDSCVRCGLCALRCPYGAISIPANRPVTKPFDAANYRIGDADAAAGILKLPRSSCITVAEIRRAVAKAVEEQRMADKSTFYPLVGALLTSIGLCTIVTRAGDTNNRMDAVIIDRMESMPIEVKSPTETVYINVKAVRQAVENKIVMTARSMFPTRAKTTTLAIGYEYPKTRSDVDELIDDVAAAYGINVGIVSLETLFVLAWNRHTRGDLSGAAALTSLRGRANATIY